MKQMILGLVLALSLTAGTVIANEENVPSDTAGQSTYVHRPGYGAKWLCESVPTWGPGYYWWLSYNYALSYRNATWACQSRHGACYTACRVVW